MKKSYFLIILAFLALIFQGFTLLKKDTAGEIAGVYWSPKKDAKIQIYLKSEQYFGKFVWLAIPRKDSKNPIKALQNREVLGLELLTGFSYNDGAYTGGEIYDPETGKTYSCKISLEGQTLKVRGYIGISLFGRTEYFERVK